MTKSTAEAFVILYKEILKPLDPGLHKIYNTIGEGRRLSQLQRLTIIRTLKQHTAQWISAGYDFFDLIKEPVWPDTSEPFGICSIMVHGNFFVISHPPTELVKQFTSSNNVNAQFCSEDDTLTVGIAATDIVREAVRKYAIEIPSTDVKQTMNRADCIYLNFKKYCPHCTIENNQVVLVNAPADAQKYWKENATGDINHDLILAKQMCFCLFFKSPQTTVEKIAASVHNEFWVDVCEFSKIAATNNFRLAVVVDQNNMEAEIAEITTELERAGMTVTHNKPVGISPIVDNCNVVFIPYGDKWGYNDTIYVDVLSDTSKFDAIATTVPFQTSNKKLLYWQEVCPLTFHIGLLTPTPNRNRHIVHL